MDPPLSLNAWLRWDVVSRILDSLPDARSVLEIGAGIGAFGARLAARYEYVGVEPDPLSCAVAKRRLERVGTGTVVCAELANAVEDRRFDVVCAFEVLEHVEDDGDALREWVDRLDDGGTLIVSVPAWQRRWRASDVHAGHVRRYDRDELRALLEACGLDHVTLIGYGFPLGHVLEPLRDLAARRARNGGDRRMRTAASGRWLQPSDRFAGVTRAATAPFRLLQRPFADSDLATGWVAESRRVV